MFDINQVLRGSDWEKAREALQADPYRRAAFDDDPWGKLQGGNALFLTELVKGYAIPTRTLGNVLFRRVGAPTVEFKYKVFNHATMTGATDTRRAPTAAFQHVKRDYEWATKKLERRGMVALADRDEITQARRSGGPVDDFSGRKVFEARMEVLKDVEVNEIGPLVTGSANYGSVLTITATNEWDHQTNGDSRSDVQNLAWQVANKQGLQIAQIGILLTHASYQAAQDDPKIKSALSLGGTTGFRANITAEDLQGYWGVGEVQVADFFRNASDPDADPTSLYGDIAVAYVIPGAVNQGFDTRETTFDGFVNFGLNEAGFALEPVYKGVEVSGVATSWLYPYESWDLPAVINTDALGLIENTKA